MNSVAIMTTPETEAGPAAEWQGVPDAIVVDALGAATRYLDALGLVHLKSAIQQRTLRGNLVMSVRDSEGNVFNIELLDGDLLQAADVRGRIVCGDLPGWLALQATAVICWEPKTLRKAQRRTRVRDDNVKEFRLVVYHTQRGLPVE